MTTKTSGRMKNWAEWLLFFSSYAPLYFIIAVKTREVSYDLVVIQTPIYHPLGWSVSIISIMFTVFMVFTIVFLLVVVWFGRESNGQPKPIKNSDKKNDLLLSYILAHVVPFAFIDYAVILNFLAFALLFFAIGLIQVRSNYLYINPVLAAMHYDVYLIDDSEQGSQMLLAKTHEQPDGDNNTLTAVELSNNVYITTN